MPTAPSLLSRPRSCVTRSRSGAARRSPRSRAAALQGRVSQLRRALAAAAERLETRPPGYALRVERDELDLDRFSQLVEDADGAEPAVAAEKLRDALALWRGPPLADVASGG